MQQLLSADEERLLIEKWQNKQDHRAVEVLIVAFKPLLLSIVKRYRYLTPAVEDLHQEALTGFAIALNRFEIERNLRLASYAKWWINACCQDYVIKNWSVVKMRSSNHTRKLFFQLTHLRKAIDKIDTNYLSDDTARQIASEIQSTQTEVQDLFTRLLYRDYSLDVKINPDSDKIYLDYLQSDAVPADELIEQAEIQLKMEQALSTIANDFTEREWDILCKRRLNPEHVHTLKELAKGYKMTKERVRQIEAKALRKLQKSLILQGIKPSSKLI